MTYSIVVEYCCFFRSITSYLYFRSITSKSQVVKGGICVIIFAERLKELRNKHKVTQTVLADLLHVSQRQVSYYEKGQDTPSLPSLIAIADYFNVSLDYLVGRSNNPKRQ